MRKLKSAIMFLLGVVCITSQSFAQATTTVSGNVKNSKSKESIAAVSVMVKGTNDGTFTDDKGNFKLYTTATPPFTLIISSVGFAAKEVNVDAAGATMNVELDVSFSLGQDIVVAASRLPERILEAPVSIERVTATQIRNIPGAGYYDALNNLKGVDVVTSSYTFKTVSTRGFNGSGNLRFNQFVDGMDNTAPALNFSVSNIVGLTELDVDNMELLSGPSSALYGSGGQNGTLIINSKDPFKYQGVSLIVKQGVMHLGDEARNDATLFQNYVLRWGQKVSDKFAFKLGAEYVKTDDWVADDKSNLARNNVLSNLKSGDRTSDPNYDGVNVLGDEASASLNGVALGGIFGPGNERLSTDIGYLASIGLLNPLDGIDATEQGTIIGYYAGQLGDPNFGALPLFANGVINGTYRNPDGSEILVSRTGYDEQDIVDYNSYNFKVSGGLYYKFTNTLTASLTGNWGNGTTVYTGADRYNIKNFTMGQYRLELKNKNWFLRGYTTQENSGDSYASTLAALGVNNAWKDNATWFGTYAATYSGSALAGADPATAHGASRGAADDGRLVPGTKEFQDAFNTITTTPISQGGAQFADQSDLWHFEGQYNLSEAIKVVDVLVGANYRTFILNSEGTIFADTAGKINIGEYGGYLQLKKTLFNDVLNLTATGRYDKNENFEGRFTPRFGASIKVAKDNNVRLSLQQAYRFPSNQDQWINLQTPGTFLIGGLPGFAEYYNFADNPVFTAESVGAARASSDPTKLVQADFVPVKPEIVNTFEIGYRGLVSKNFLVDAYFYSSKYTDFIARAAVARGYSGNPLTSPVEVLNPFTSTNYSFVTNSPNDVKAIGWGLSMEYRTNSGFNIMGNIYGDELRDVQEGLVTFFNTPKLRFNLGLGNSDVYKGLGFNMVYRWQDNINWEGTFGSGDIPSFGVMDAAISYKLPKTKHQIKIGGQNLFNNYYRNAFGNPYVGGLYYISLGYNVL